jgi:hypothetical protein
MMEWFRSGGFGMFAVLILGAGAIGFGAKAIGKPTAERLAALRSLPALIGLASLAAFGTNMWAVNKALSDESFQKARGLAQGDLPVVAMIGFTESVQVFTLAGLLAAAVVVLRMVAEARAARTTPSP